MPLLQEVRSLLRRRRKPTVIDLTGTQAEGLATTTELGTESNGAAVSTIEMKPPSRGRADSTGGQEEVLGLIRRIDDHLEGHADRTERLIGLMERLPQALDALPEINRQNTRLVETLHDHFGQAKRREETLNTTLGAISESSGRQTEVLGLVQQHLDVSAHATETLTGTLDTLRGSLSDLATSNGRTAEVIQTMSDAANRRERELTAIITRTQRWMIGAVCFCGAASILAMVIASVALTR